MAANCDVCSERVYQCMLSLISVCCLLSVYAVSYQCMPSLISVCCPYNVTATYKVWRPVVMFVVNVFISICCLYDVTSTAKVWRPVVMFVVNVYISVCCLLSVYAVSYQCMLSLQCHGDY